MMQKSLLYSMIFASITLFGCDSSPKITVDAQKAKEIALAQAGSGMVTDFSFDSDDKIPNYDITVIDGQTEYEFEISAIDGAILQSKVDIDEQIVVPQVTITEETAREIALAEVAGTITSVRLDQDDHQYVYEIVLFDETYKYEFEISATDGTILTQNKKIISTGMPSVQGVNIDEATAKEIALNEVEGGVITSISFDYEDDTPVYDVEIVKDRTEYEFEINAIDGSIISKNIDVKNS